MDESERIAHHEAAHAVICLLFGLDLTNAGIDLAAATRNGAAGQAGVYLHAITAGAPVSDNNLLTNAAICAAGAASDARIFGEAPLDAFKKQVGDWQAAENLFALAGKGAADDPDGFMAAAIEAAYERIERPLIWQAIEAVATATLNNGGVLDPDAIKRLAQPLIDQDAQTRAPSI